MIYAPEELERNALDQITRGERAMFGYFTEEPNTPDADLRAAAEQCTADFQHKNGLPPLQLYDVMITHPGGCSVIKWWCGTN